MFKLHANCTYYSIAGLRVLHFVWSCAISAARQLGKRKPFTSLEKIGQPSDRKPISVSIGQVTWNMSQQKQRLVQLLRFNNSWNTVRCLHTFCLINYINILQKARSCKQTGICSESRIERKGSRTQISDVVETNGWN